MMDFAFSNAAANENLLDGGLDTGLDGFVLCCSLLAGYDSLLGRFDVCHFISSEIKLFSNKYVFLIPFIRC